MAGEPDARIEIRVSCTKLKKKDTFSKSDPCCIMSIQEGESWTEVGRTEIIKNNENPQFTTALEAEYFFQRTQKVRFDVYDIDSKSAKLTDHDHLGFMETTLSEVVSNSPLTKSLTIKDKPVESTMTLHVQELSKHQESLQMVFSGQKLDKKDFMSKSDPFLTFSRKDGEHNWTPVLKTEVIKNNLNPTWKPVKAKISQLCGGDHDQVIKVDCYDYDSDGSNDLIGSFTTSVRELIKEGIGGGKQWPLINPKKAQKKGYQNSGVAILSSCELVRDS